LSARAIDGLTNPNQHPRWIWFGFLVALGGTETPGILIHTGLQAGDSSYRKMETV
jgi:hypothetical protein